MSEPLIPILGVVKRTRERRVAYGHEEWPRAKCRKQNIRKLHTWIDENTTGKFYLDPNCVSFENERDFIIFKLGYKDD